MQTSLDTIVNTLYGRIQRPKAELIVPSRLFVIAADLVVTLAPAERHRQLQILLGSLEAATTVVVQPQGDRTQGSFPALLLTVAALLAVSGDSKHQATDGSGVDDSRYQQAVAHLLRSDPPYEDAVRFCAWYGVAHLTLLSRAEDLFTAACHALSRDSSVLAAENDLPVTEAVELLSAVTSQLVLCRSSSLSLEAIEDPMANTPKSRMTGDKKKADVRSTLEDSASTQKASSLPTADMALPVVSQETAAGLRTRLIQCALKALGPDSLALREGVPPAVLCRRVLIPLLLLDGREGLESHAALVEDLLTLLAADEDDQKMGEVVVLMAALFDFLFLHPNLKVSEDYRFSELLWTALSRALLDSLTAETDAGRRANMQLRVGYLLKRIVHLTKQQEDGDKGNNRAPTEKLPAAVATLPSQVHFHELFVWTRRTSHSQWGLFFLVLETLNEFGLHIIQPAMVKLDALVTQLAQSLNGDGAALHPTWVELLLLKLIRHPNLGVRKMGLRRVWALPMSVLCRLSDAFLFSHVFQSSSDPRLCADLDRVPITSSFLETKAFEGTEEQPMPQVEPLADEIERFYAALFLQRQQSAESRGTALLSMLDTTMQHTARFTVTIFVRTLHHLSESLAAEATERGPTAREWTVGMLLNTAVLEQLAALMRHTMYDNVPFWLGVRITALVFAALLTFASLDPSRCRAVPLFWRLLCMCGPLGQSGGHHLTRLDACGQYGCGHANLDPSFLNDRLARQPAPLVAQLLDTTSLVDRTRAILRHSGPFSESAVKQHFFGVGVLALTGEAMNDALLREVADLVSHTVASHAARAYASDVGFVTSVAAFVELHRSLGSVTATRYFSLSVLTEMRAAVHARAMGALEDATAALGTLRSLDDVVAPSWALVHREAWEVLAAAVVSINQVALQHNMEGAAAVLGTKHSIRYLSDYIASAGQRYSHMAGVTSEPDGSGGDITFGLSPHQSRLMALILLARNASKMLQSELCGFVYVEGGDGVLRASPEEAQVGCFLGLSSTDAVTYIEWLIPSLTQRLTTSAAACALSGVPWSTVLSEHFSCVYNSIYVLCQRVDMTSAPETVASLEAFALSQVERCWTTNLASVYDILGWVASCPDGRVVDHVLVAETMFAHCRDVSAKQHGRLAAMAFNALHHLTLTHPEYVARRLQDAMENDTDGDRTMYMVAVTASLQVLSDRARTWPHLKEVLLHAAVLFNPGRDEEENESTMAATEPLMRSWPEELRKLYPATVRMSGVGRALALSTILHSCAQDAGLAQSLCLELIRMNVDNPVITHEPCMPNSKTHRARVRLWQLLCALLPLLPSDLPALTRIFEAVLKDCVTVNNLGSVRRLIELFACCLLRRQPSLYTLVASILGNYGLRPQVCGTYVLIACYALLQQEDLQAKIPEQPGLFEALFPRLLQQSTSNQHLLRIISHIGVYRICVARQAKGKPISADAAAIFSYLSTAGEHVKFRQKHEAMLFYDIAAASTPRHIFCVMRKEANTVLRECVPAAAFERIRFLETELCCLMGSTFPIDILRSRAVRPSRMAAATSVLNTLRDAPYIPHTHTRADYFVDYTAEAVALLCSDSLLNGLGDDGEVEDNIQKKVTSWWDSEVYNELHPRALRQDRQSIVVVGSLLENPVNIAGLCRCGEIFTVEEIVIPEKKVFDHPHFVATARSAELWIPWKEVGPMDLPAYLTAMRHEGYAIVGIEQTANSVSMASYNFPERVVVVLGAEGRGIPAPLIPLLDVCVEIPQYGLIRSLNVHVTGAIVMYEYTRQHRMCSAV